jgi:hypothetical protein
MRGFAAIFGDFTYIASAKINFFRRAFAKQLCRRAFGKTMMTHLCQQVGMRGIR